MSSEADLAPQRLHVLSLPFSFLSHAKGFVLPLLLFLVVKRESSWELWAAIFLVPAMVVELWRYLSLRYWIEDDELVVRQGVVQKSERHVPLARIQTIDSTQNVLQRLFDVVEVCVETAGSGEPEAHLRVLSLAARDELRRRVFEGRAAAAVEDAGTDRAEAPADGTGSAGYAPLFRTSAGELALLGLSPGRGLAILAGIVGLVTQLDVVEDEQYASLYDWATAHLAGELLVDVLIGLALVLLVLGLSLLSVFVRLFDFRLERRGAEFRTECGLVTRHSTTIPVRRIQFVSVQASPILRLFRKRLIKVRTAGARSQGDATALTRQWLLPVVAAERVPELVRSIVPGCTFTGEEDLAWRTLAPAAPRRALRKSLVAGVLATAVPAILWARGVEGAATATPWVAVLFLGLFPTLAWLTARAYRWAHTPWGLVTREGILGRRFAFVPGSRVQTVSLRSSPFDRRWGHAGLRVDTAGANIGHRADLPCLAADEAEVLARHLVRDAERPAAAAG